MFRETPGARDNLWDATEQVCKNKGYPIMDERLLLLTQLIKLGVAAAIAAAWLRSRDFKRWLFQESPSLRQRIYMVLLLSVPYSLGVVVRQNVSKFLAA